MYLNFAEYIHVIFMYRTFIVKIFGVGNRENIVIEADAQNKPTHNQPDAEVVSRMAGALVSAVARLLACFTAPSLRTGAMQQGALNLLVQLLPTLPGSSVRSLSMAARHQEGRERVATAMNLGCAQYAADNLSFADRPAGGPSTAIPSSWQQWQRRLW